MWEAGMREIVIISGKGGTGKTSLCAAFAALARNAVLCDLDVDVPDLHIVLNPKDGEGHVFMGGNKAQVREEDCIGCGQCADLCRFDAITMDEDRAHINELNCEGCGVCVTLCPQKALDFPAARCGDWYVGETRFGPFLHAVLVPGQENSGKLVTLLKREARELARSSGRELILCDGSPGIGCPVISSLSGATLAVAVVEPSLSGSHDFDRVARVCAHFRVPIGVIVNKADINPEETDQIIAYCEREGHTILGTVPFSADITRATIEGRAITETDSELAARLAQIWEKVDALAESKARERLQLRSFSQASLA